MWFSNWTCRREHGRDQAHHEAHRPLDERRARPAASAAAPGVRRGRAHRRRASWMEDDPSSLPGTRRRPGLSCRIVRSVREAMIGWATSSTPHSVGRPSPRASRTLSNARTIMSGSPDPAGLSRPRSVSAEHGSPPSPDGPGGTLRAMRILYLATSGAADPTRASIPLHLAVNGSLEVGHDVGIVLAGD